MACKRFVVLGRAKKSEPRGCGDIMGDKIVASQVPTARTPERKDGTRSAFLFDGTQNHCPSGLFDPVEPSRLPRVDVAELCADLRQRRERLNQYSIDELVALVNKRRGQLQPTPRYFRCEQRTTVPQQLVSRREHATGSRSVPKRNEGLGRWTQERREHQSSARLLSPRGLVSHWLAGNVPLLGMLALAQSVVTRNANLMKVASTFSSVLPALLETFRDLEVKTPGGKVLFGNDILAATAVVYPRDFESASTMS